MILKVDTCDEKHDQLDAKMSSADKVKDFYSKLVA